MRKELVLTLVLLSVTPFAFAASKDQTAPFRESVSVNLVEVPVTVVSRDGNPVRGLTAANFEIIDDGVKRPISNFEVAEMSHEAQQDQRTTTPAPVVRRNFLLLFDLSYSTPPILARSRVAAQQFVEKDLLPSDVASVATFTVEDGFRILTAFTTDRTLTASALDSIGQPKLFKPLDPLLLSGMIEPGLAVGNQSSSGQSSEQIESMKDFARMHDRDMDAYNRGRIRAELQSFGQLARMLDHLHGTKQVILFSEGFDSSLLQGRDSTPANEKDFWEEQAATESGETWKVDMDKRFGSSSTATELKAMAQLFRRSDVVLHAIDIKGIRTEVDARTGLRHDSNESLYLLAAPTGGQVFKNSNRLIDDLKDVLRQQEVVYLLAFNAPASGSPGKFHDLKVKLVNVSAARVSHRAGYYEPSPVSNGLEQKLSAGDILLNDVVSPDVKLHLLAAPFPSTPEESEVPVILEIDGPSVLDAVKDPVITADLYVYAFDQQNSVRDFLYQRIALDRAKVGEKMRTGGIKFYGILRLKPGTYAVKTLFRLDGSAGDGFARTDVVVPDFAKPVVLSPFVEDEGRTWLMVKAATRSGEASAGYPFSVKHESFVPAAEVRMKQGSPYHIAVLAYHYPLDQARIAASVRDAKGSTIPATVSVKTAGPSDVAGRFEMSLDFTPPALAAERYVLELTLQQPGGAPLTATLPFVIEPKQGE